jgi:hypothetical protein
MSLHSKIQGGFRQASLRKIHVHAKKRLENRLRLGRAVLHGGTTSSCTRMYTPGLVVPSLGSVLFGVTLRAFKIAPDDFAAAVQVACRRSGGSLRRLASRDSV